MGIIAAILIVLGIVFFFGSVVGLLRFPDFYTRMHAAGKGDTLSTVLILGGFILHNFSEGSDAGSWNVLVKLCFIALFIMLTSPTSTHALMKAGYESGNDPETLDDEEPVEKEGNAP
jgi:multicomponent Na+:H+ antiporter subunit G